MFKVRLIPVLLLQNGPLVGSESFTEHQIIGNPIHEVRRFNEWNVDELVYLDMTGEGQYDLRREDHKIKGLDDPLEEKLLSVTPLSLHCAGTEGTAHQFPAFVLGNR